MSPVEPVTAMSIWSTSELIGHRPIAVTFALGTTKAMAEPFPSSSVSAQIECASADHPNQTEGKAVADEAMNQDNQPASRGKKVSFELIAAGLLAVVLLIFIVQNDEDVKVSWVVFSRRAAVWTVILASAVLGYVIGQLIEYSIKRRRRQKAESQS